MPQHWPRSHTRSRFLCRHHIQIGLHQITGSWHDMVESGLRVANGWLWLRHRQPQGHRPDIWRPGWHTATHPVCSWQGYVQSTDPQKSYVISLTIDHDKQMNCEEINWLQTCTCCWTLYRTTPATNTRGLKPADELRRRTRTFTAGTTENVMTMALVHHLTTGYVHRQHTGTIVHGAYDRNMLKHVLNHMVCTNAYTE